MARFASLDVAPDLAVLIVSYQSAADLGLLFDSLRAEAVGAASGSSWPTTINRRLSARAQGDVVVIETGGDLDYGGGLNAGPLVLTSAAVWMTVSSDHRVSINSICSLVRLAP